MDLISLTECSPSYLQTDCPDSTPYSASLGLHVYSSFKEFGPNVTAKTDRTLYIYLGTWDLKLSGGTKVGVGFEDNLTAFININRLTKD
ncbi:hypothetical protein FG05_35109 [Fusarium graminearum]|nr:hypothetical protein FG05_35109 [Fusarium graminearum]